MTEDVFRGVLKDKFTLSLSVIGIFFLLLGILSLFNISLGNNFIAQAISIFPGAIWITLAVITFCASILAYLKKYNLMILFLLIALIGITALIRTSNINDLKDVTTGDWTLGPDLDPFLYLRHANEIANGTIQNPDVMRSAPIGADNYAYQNLMPWAIVLIQKIVSIFKPISIEYAAIISPVLFFCLSLVGFFLFMYFLSLLKFSKKTSLAIALFASIFYSIIPSMLARTVAGDSEIESLGMVWFWLAFLFYILAWKTDKLKLNISLATLAGIFTGAMSWTWGGYRYIYMTISLVTLVLFIFQKEERKNLVIFSSWIIPSLILEFLRKKSINAIMFGTNISDTGLATITLLFLITAWIFSNTRLKETIDKINLPRSVISILVAGILVLISLLILKRDLLINLLSRLVEGFLYPWNRDRISLTVAENRAPYFSEVLGEFGNLVWLFLIGVIIIFYKATTHFKKQHETAFEKWSFGSIVLTSIALLIFCGNILIGPNYSSLKDQIDLLIFISLLLPLFGWAYSLRDKNSFLSLNFSFVLLILCTLFSRISYQSTFFNGEDYFSKIIYYSGIIFFILTIGITYLKACYKKDERMVRNFREINLLYILVLVLSFLEIISMRGAIRLFFIISPMMVITSSFLFVEVYDLKRYLDKRIVFVILLAFSVVFLQIAISYTLQTEYSAKGMIPSGYHQQWQSAMGWVRDNTPLGSIFVSWWDYGYWIQTLGQRPTVVDGGHVWGYWDHLVGRYVLTAPLPEIALSYAKAYNVSYLLIDSTDIGKYPAFSKIGSDKTGEDRYSQIPIFVVDPKQTRETSNKTMKVYTGGGILDQDILYNYGEKDTILPKEKSYLIAIIFETSNKNNESVMDQPKGIFYYNSQQFSIPIRYVYYNEKSFDYKKGLNATIDFVPQVSVTSEGVQVDETGTVVYLSPKVTNSLLGQLYLLNNSSGEYGKFELVHSEQDSYVKYLKANGLNLGDFAYIAGDIRGPIKIWRINPDENILVHPEFLRTSGEYGEFDNLDFTNS